MSDELPIGIDLGTTFSCIAVYRNGKAELIPDRYGERLIPSIVYYDHRSGLVHVGKCAEVFSAICPGNCLIDSKRILGRKYDDEFLLRFYHKYDIPVSLTRGDNDKAVFQLNIRGESVFKTPEEVSAEILKYLKNMAREYLGKDITDVVISIPAYFSNAQRKATKKAAELAGLKLLKFITEPTAGALHYVQDKNTTSKLLVFHWGGGTLDVSLLTVNNKVFEVKSVYGDSLLGGRNIDYRLFEHFYKPVENDKFWRRLQVACEDMKEKLSTLNQFDISIECYDGVNDFKLSLTRKQFDSLTEDIFQSAIEIVEHGLYDAGWKNSDVKEVVLVGGSTKIPRIRTLLERLFGSKILKTDFNSDEAVAIGACLQAAMLQSEFASAEKYKITEVTPLSLGIRINRNLMRTMVKRNTPLPVISEVHLETVANNQESCEITIFEGEKKNTDYNNELGSFTLNGLPRKRAGDVRMTIIFHLDEDGVLTVTASEDSTGKSNKLAVILGEFRLSERKVKISVQEAERNKLEDDVFEMFARYRDAMQTNCYKILYDLSEISTESNRNIVKSKCQDFLNYSDDLYFTEIVELEKHYKLLYEAVEPILSESGM